ncbi:hypothetical protein EXS70_02110 [Candidatus Peribacteria bacterium]|nr:hypothetical protein [Candidatus Peribacteria bacterium]
MHNLALRLKGFAMDHDDLPAFHAGYIALTLIAAALFNVGLFALLTAAHAGLDIVKYREIHHRSWKRTLLSTFREGLFDILMLTVGLTLSVYLHHDAAGIVALSGMLRIEVSVLRGLILLVPRVEILWHLLGVFVNVKLHLLQSSEACGPWRRIERVNLAGVLLALTLLTLAPILLDPSTVGSVLVDELVPWRF